MSPIGLSSLNLVSSVCLGSLQTIQLDPVSLLCQDQVSHFEFLLRKYRVILVVDIDLKSSQVE